MLDFARRVERSREAHVHKDEFTSTLKDVYWTASIYLDKTLPTQLHIKTEKPFGWISPEYAMTDKKYLQLTQSQDVSIRLGKEKAGFIDRLTQSKPTILIESWHLTRQLPAIARNEQYLLTSNGNLKIFDPSKNAINIPDEEFAKRVKLVQEVVTAFTGRSQ